MSTRPPARGRRDSFAERSLALRDAAAVGWLQGRGLWCEPRGPFHLFADRLVDGPFELLRVWHTPARVGRSAQHPSSGTVIQIDGAIVLSTATESVGLEPGGVALLPSSGPWTLEGAVASARIEIRSRPGLWPPDVARHRIETLDAISTPFREVLVATAISALSSSLRPEDAGFSAFRQAVENLVAGLPALRSGPTATTPEETLRREALQLIAKEAADPDLTVAGLADRLLVSDRHLHRAFAEHGATPLAEIRAARADLARQHLALHPGRTGPDRLEIARRSGFRTVRAMNEALRASR